MITRTLLLWCLSAGYAWAQEPDLVVVLSSAQDELLADKLAELIREPFERVSAVGMPPTAAATCSTRARLELTLDSEQHAVRLVRCSDATVLARGLDPEAAKQSPYLGAFVAAELLSINRELEAVEARAAAAPEHSSESTVAVAPAAVSGSVPTPHAPASEPDRSWLVLVRAGAELTLWGAPFDRAIRPSLGLGLAHAPSSLPVAFFAELRVGLFANAEENRRSEQLKLRRHELQLHAGVRVPVGPLVLSGFGLLRGSLTNADYTAQDLNNSSTHVRYGLGAGATAEMPLSQAFAVYTQVTLDVATSRSDYRVAGTSWVSDPSSLFWVGLGFLLRVYP